jgi:hypothetical protein
MLNVGRHKQSLARARKDHSHASSRSDASGWRTARQTRRRKASPTESRSQNKSKSLRKISNQLRV